MAIVLLREDKDIQRETQGCMHAQRGDHTKRHQEGGHLQAKERGYQEKPALLEPGFGLQASRTVRKWISVVQVIESVVFSYVSPRNLIQRVFWRVLIFQKMFINPESLYILPVWNAIFLITLLP